MLIRWRDNSFPAMSNMFDDFLSNDLTSFFGRDLTDVFDRNPNMVMPAVNVKETQDAFQIEVAAPGLNKEDFKLNLDRNILTLSAHKETRTGYDPGSQSRENEQGQENQQATSMAEAQDTGQRNSTNEGADESRPAAQSAAMQNRTQNQMERYTRREFSYTSFQRSFSLPETTEPESISANYENGILTINVPKRKQNQASSSRSIDIS